MIFIDESIVEYSLFEYLNMYSNIDVNIQNISEELFSILINI